MANNEELSDLVKEWIKTNNTITTLQSEIKKQRKHKTIITERLLYIMKNNDIDGFDITDGQLMYKNKVKSTIGKNVTRYAKSLLC